MRTCLLWIQSHPHGVILRHLLNMVNSFFCSSINYFENRLLPNDLIIVRNHRDDEEDKWDVKRALERQGDTHMKVEIQSNSEFQSLTLSPTQSLGPPQLQIDVQDPYDIGFGRSTYSRKDNKIKFPMEPVHVQLNSSSTRTAEISSISRVQLVQELSTLKLMPRSHTTSNLGILRLPGKIGR
jgi:hypothetical protein